MPKRVQGFHFLHLNAYNITHYKSGTPSGTFAKGSTKGSTSFVYSLSDCYRRKVEPLNPFFEKNLFLIIA